jgi:hypothetical protein
MEFFMIDIVKKIFKDKGYSIFSLEENKNINFVINGNNEKSEYFFIYDLESKEEIDKKVKNLIEIFIKKDFLDSLSKEKIKKFNNIYRDIDKNTSVLFLVEDDNTDFFRIEEEPYNFKRYVLNYSENEYLELKKELGKNLDDINLLNKLDSIIKDRKLYKNYKENRGKKKDLYSIASKLYFKIPFLNYKFDGIKIDDINSNINETLKDNKDFKDEILNIGFDTEEIIKSTYKSDFIKNEENEEKVNDDLRKYIKNKLEELNNEL